MSANRKSPGTPYGPDDAAMQAYLKDGERRALELGNRGPIRFTRDGALDPDILEAYDRCGFYVFETNSPTSRRISWIFWIGCRAPRDHRLTPKAALRWTLAAGRKRCSGRNRSATRSAARAS